ncbi:hypothetical protein Zmor_024309 [Zophobas morio]|uniref:Uncharacterized protein n=1 Tax=Zophobas morio TaxID=2755281 RepID=A0AA38M876_9CUCU|nr:hypothetical protein Zmor_024309 [Zophobas morio]
MFLFVYTPVKIIIMAGLTEKERIETLMMVGYGDRLRSHEEMYPLFSEVHFEQPPIVRGTISGIVAKFNQTGNVRDITRCGRPLSLEHNSHVGIALHLCRLW